MIARETPPKTELKQFCFLVLFRNYQFLWFRSFISQLCLVVLLFVNYHKPQKKMSLLKDEEEKQKQQ